MGCATSKGASDTHWSLARPQAHAATSGGMEVKLQPTASAFYDPPPEQAELFKRAAAAAQANTHLPLGASPPANEGLRIKALRQLHAMEHFAERDARLARIVDMMRTTFMVDFAAISLIDVDQQVIKVSSGFAFGSTDRQSAFGSWELNGDSAAVLVVEDARLDARFCHNKHVTGPPHVRFYAGAPLVGSDSAVYGVLWIADRKPRHFAAEQLTILANFAELCTRKFEAARLPELQQQAEAALKGQCAPLVRDLSKLQEPVLLCNLAAKRWKVVWANHELADLAGIPQESAPTRDLWSLFRLAGSGSEAQYEAAIKRERPFSVAVQPASQPGGSAGAGSCGVLELRFMPASQGLPSIGLQLPSVGVPCLGGSDDAAGHRDVLATDLHHLFWAAVVPADQARSAWPPGTGTASGDASISAGSSLDALLGAGAARRAAEHAAADVAPRHGASHMPPRTSFALSSAAQPPSLTILAKANKEAVFRRARLGTLLGAGSYGMVYRGWWRGARVAIKVMDYYCPLILDDLEITAERHSVLLEALLGQEYTRHPALVQTYDFGLRPADAFDPDNPPQGPVRHTVWMVNELCNRGTLSDAVMRGRFRLSPADAHSPPNLLFVLQTAQEIAGGMSLLHDSAILHSDLSAHNVLLKAAANSRRFKAAVSDFGLSRICADADGRHTQTVGTVTHQPPELLKEGILTPATDCYAFGILLWTMYCGEQPFSGLLPCTIIHRVITSPRCPLELPADAPQGFRDLFERCVAQDRTQRPSFDEVLELLEPLLQAAEAAGPLPPSPSPFSPAKGGNEGRMF